MFGADCFTLGIIIEVLNTPEDASAYVCKEREVKIIGPRCEATTGKFFSFYDTIGSTVGQGSY